MPFRPLAEQTNDAPDRGDVEGASLRTRHPHGQQGARASPRAARPGASQPLVLNTRPRAQAAALSACLRQLGLEPLEAPATRIVAAWSAPSVAAVRERLRQGAYAWTVVPSANAARLLQRALDAVGGSAQDLASTRVLAGPATAEVLAMHHVRVERVLPRFSAAAALEALTASGPTPGDPALASELTSGCIQAAPGSGKQGVAPPSDARGSAGVLLPGAAEGREELAEGLRQHGIRFEALPLYRAVAAPPASLAPAADRLRAGAVAAVTFASPSAVGAFVQGLRALGHDPGVLLRNVLIACIGRTTAEAIRRHGLAADAVAEQTTAASLAQAVAGTLAERDARV